MIDNKNSKTDKSRKESFPNVQVNWDSTNYLNNYRKYWKIHFF